MQLKTGTRKTTHSVHRKAHHSSSSPRSRPCRNPLPIGELPLLLPGQECLPVKVKRVKVDRLEWGGPEYVHTVPLPEAPQALLFEDPGHGLRNARLSVVDDVLDLDTLQGSDRGPVG